MDRKTASTDAKVALARLLWETQLQQETAGTEPETHEDAQADVRVRVPVAPRCWATGARSRNLLS